MTEKEHIDSYLLFAQNTLKKAGDILLSYRDRFRIQKTKDILAMDIATSADYAAEGYIINEIKTRYPDHGILTEETSGLESDSEYRWIIDPLDGTKEYIRHSPYFYTLLALEYKGELIIGTGYQPVFGRMFAAGQGKGLKVDGHEATLSPQTTLAKSFVSVALPYRNMPAPFLNPYMELLEGLVGRCYRLRNTAWDVEALFNVASGLVEAYVLPPHEPGRGPKPWDIASGLMAVLATGGNLTDFYGQNLASANIEKGIVASNGRIHAELLGVVQSLYLHKQPPA